ncbi:MAG: hypothetical protein A2451_16255 [Bdellovibrionales bacterium RIFOXYC2_FULL_39_8]|nr:MAG: hypothetical protein A2451_16255 [Bdellovibrionales bacterium RIFOXYC2_FULL_39_8]
MGKSINLLALMILVLSTACSGLKRPESISEKMARYTPHEAISNRVPEMAVFTESDIFKQNDNNATSTTGRGPASIKEPTGRPSPDDSEDLNYSNKRLYFLALLSQYDALSIYSKQRPPKVDLCPNFHNSLLDYKDSGKNVARAAGPNAIWWGKYTKILSSVPRTNSEQLVALYPELALPINGDSIRPRVIDIAHDHLATNGQTAIIQQAIDLHILKLHRELDELCETGTSSNYFTFENLYSYVKQHPEFEKSPSSLKVLFKTTVFANLVLIDSITHTTKEELKSRRGIASNNNEAPYDTRYVNELVNRFNIHWTYNYLDDLVKIRRQN